MRDPVFLSSEEADHLRRAVGAAWGSQAAIATEVGVAQGTVSNFLFGKPIHRTKARDLVDKIIPRLPVESPLFVEIQALRERIMGLATEVIKRNILPVGPMNGFANCIREELFHSAPLPQQGFSFVVGEPQFGVSTALRSISSDSGPVLDTSALILQNPEGFLDFLVGEYPEEFGFIQSRTRTLPGILSEIVTLSRRASVPLRALTFIVDDFHTFEAATRRMYYGVFATLAAHRAYLPIRGLVGIRKATWDKDAQSGYSPAEQFPSLLLKPFDPQEISELLGKFHLPENQAARLMAEFHGHPQRTHQAIWDMAQAQ